ncbi:uncharacterized protein ARMOST_06076 [Armillaria ostoyae]|uniref:Uncharacterized protein n=1 Tax=Armillaria ostoyae TaxID=47428 RepID=A0A284R209_ARMOS|nr:uncharacterized protein ARMOST_06076 [Armillaria ostoyae]
MGEAEMSARAPKQRRRPGVEQKRYADANLYGPRRIAFKSIMCTVYNGLNKGIQAARHFAIISISKPKAEPTCRTILQKIHRYDARSYLRPPSEMPACRKLDERPVGYEDVVIGWTFDSYIWLQV